MASRIIDFVSRCHEFDELAASDICKTLELDFVGAVEFLALQRGFDSLEAAYLFARYRKWRASFGLLATNLTQEQFAFAVQSHGIKTDFDRKLFFDAQARWEDPAKPAPASENTVANVADSPQ